MTQVIDITGFLEEQAEQRIIEEQKEYMNWLISQLTPEELEQAMVAMDTGDLDLYKSITEPIIMREAIREFNTGGKRYGYGNEKTARQGD